MKQQAVLLRSSEVRYGFDLSASSSSMAASLFILLSILSENKMRQ
jgi:hypothetical protein